MLVQVPPRPPIARRPFLGWLVHDDDLGRSGTFRSVPDSQLPDGRLLARGSLERRHFPPQSDVAPATVRHTRAKCETLPVRMYMVGHTYQGALTTSLPLLGPTGQSRSVTSAAHGPKGECLAEVSAQATAPPRIHSMAPEAT